MVVINPSSAECTSEIIDLRWHLSNFRWHQHSPFALRGRQMAAMGSQITGQSTVCSTNRFGLQQRNIKCLHYYPFARESTGGRWFLRTEDSNAEIVSI